MAWFDVDGFLAGVPAPGVPAAQVPLYREASVGLLAGAPGGPTTRSIRGAGEPRAPAGFVED